MDYEDVLNQVGDFGKYQILLVILVLVPTSSISILYDFLFMMHTPDHWCRVNKLANFSYDQQIELIRPMTIEQGIEVRDKCRMFDIDYNSVASTGQLPNDSSLLPTKACDNGWIYDDREFGETAATKFNLVCEDSHFAHSLLSLGALGIVVATPLISPLSDRIGRRYSFLLVLIIYSCACMSPILFRDLISFAIARFVGHGMLNVYYQIPFILVMESVGSAHRTKISFLSAFGYSLGSCILPMMAYFTSHWVKFSITQFLLAVPFFIGFKFLPESGSWLITQERYEDAHKVVKKIAKVNGKKEPSDLMSQLQKVGLKQAEAKNKKQNDSTWDFFLVPELRKNFIISTLIFASNTVAYTGLAINSLNFHGSEFLNYFLLALIDVPSLLLGWWLVEGRLGRRWSNSMFLILCGVSLCLPALIPPNQKILITILSLIGKFGTAASYMIIYQQAAELFPTTLRSQGIGISTTVSAATGICIPFITYLGRYLIWIPLFIMGSICFFVGIAASFLPETLNENLPQCTKDVKKFCSGQKYFSLAKTKSKISPEKPREMKIIVNQMWDKPDA